MSPEKPNLRMMFTEALEKESAEARGEYLDEACDGDSELRARLEALLSAHGAAGAFLGGEASGSRRREVAERPGDSIGSYTLLEELGEGGFGVVFMAEQVEPVRRRVALKILKPGMDSKQVVARFEAERQALALMEHPNIARVFDAGATPTGRPYFVMELVRGVSITEYCDTNRLSSRERLDLFMTVCHAVQHAHQKGVIHRDIKPSNVLVTLRDGKPVPKVIDFGVAKATNARLTEKTLFTQFHQMVGTPAYMSPEQAELSGLDIDTRSDIYSLGVLLYELLTGTTPLELEKLLEGSYAELQRLICDEEPARPSLRISSLAAEKRTAVAKRRQVNPDSLSRSLRGDLDWIVLKALQKDRTLRYATSSEFAADIARHLNFEVVLAGPPSKVYRLRKFIRKNRGPVLATGSIMLVICLALLVSIAMYIVADRARTDREAALRAKHDALLQQKTATYISQMNLIQRSIESGAVNSVADLLAEQIPDDGEPDLRGYEWYYYFKRYGERSELTLVGHGDRVTGVDLSSDGELLASGSWDRTVKLWETRTGKVLSTLRWEYRIDELSLSHDARLVAAAAGDKVACWNLETNELRRLDRGGARVTSLSFAPNRNMLAAGGADGIVRLWDLDTGTEDSLSSQSSSHSAVRVVRFSTDGHRIRVVYSGPEMTVFHLGTRTQERVSLGDTPAHASAAISPDGRIACFDGGHGKVIIRDLATGQQTEWAGHRDIVRALAFSPDGTTLASGSNDKRVLVWNLSAENPLHGQLILTGHRNRVDCLSYSGDGKLLASGGQDHLIKLWGLQKEIKPVTFRVPLHQEDYRGIVIDSLLAFSPNGKWLAAQSEAQVVSVVDLDSRRIESGFEVSGSSLVRGLEFAPDSSSLAVSQADGRIWLWDVASRRLSLLSPDPAPQWDLGPLPSLAFSPDGKLLAGGFETNRVKLWHLRTRRECAVLEGMPNWALCFSPDGNLLAGVSHDGRLRVVEVRTGEEIFVAEREGGNPPDELAHSKALVAVCLAFSPDGKLLVGGQGQGIVKVWDVEQRQEAMQLKGHVGEVCTVAFSPDGRDLATGGWDRSVRLWDLSLGQQRIAFREHAGGVLRIAFSPEGTMLSADSSGNVIAWDAAEGEDVQTVLDAADREFLVTRPYSTLREILSSNEHLKPVAMKRVIESLEQMESTDSDLPHLEILGLALSYDSPARDLERAREYGRRLLRSGSNTAGWRVLHAVATAHADAGHLEKAVQVIEDGCIEPRSDPARLSLMGLAAYRRELYPYLPTYASIDDALERLTSGRILVAADAKWRFLRGTREPSPGLEWTRTKFNDSTWEEPARASFGYGGGDDSTVLPKMRHGYTTLYLRHVFDVPDPDDLAPLKLSVFVDDGCVAYLNGSEIGRVRAGNPGDRLTFDALATAPAPEPVTPVVFSVDRALLRKGTNVLALQGLNQTRSSSDFSLYAELRESIEGEQLRRKLLEQARSRLEPSREALRRRGAKTLLLYLEGRLLQHAGRLGAAIKTFEDLRTMDLQRPEPVIRLTECLRDSGRPSDAESQIREALAKGCQPAWKLWETWFRLACADLDPRPKDLVASLPFMVSAVGTEVGGHVADLRWVFEQLATAHAIRINCGGKAYSGEHEWGRDRFFRGGRVDAKYTIAIEGTDDDELYQSERFFVGGGGYRIPVPPGRYQVTLHFAEIFLEKDAWRNFDVSVEGEPAAEEYKLFELGSAISDRVRCERYVTDGAVDIQLTPRRGNPKISAIEVDRLRD